MLRQASEQLGRVKALVPTDLPARLVLGNIYSGLSPGRALQVATDIRADPDLRPLGLTNEVEIALLEARAWFAMTNRGMAQGIIYALVDMHPGEDFVFDRCVATLIAGQSYADARKIIDRQLALAPNDLSALAAKVNLCFQTGDYSNAIPPLIVEASVRFAYSIFLVASLGFLGLGVPPPSPDWGLQVNEARTFVDIAPWMMAFPAAAIALLVIGTSLMADGLRYVFSPPGAERTR
jgi:hypothetical protein